MSMAAGAISSLRIMPAARWLRALLLLLLTALAGASSHAEPVAEASPRHILMLYAYGYGGRGVELFNDGFFKVITAAGFPVSNIHAEYLDLQRNRDLPGYRQEVLDVLRKKYARQRIDLIITVQQPALGFLLNEGREIAPQAPVITIQHRPLLETEKVGRRIVGEVNNFDIKGTLERALELFPRMQRVLFASGSSEADVAVAEQAARVAEAWRGRLEFEYTTGKTLAEILQRVASLPPHSIIVFTQYNRDPKDRVALAYEAENMIVKAATAPVFGFYDYNLKNGGIGGSVIAVEASGAHSGQLALDILKGEGPAATGTLSINQNVPMFDWPQIQRWGGDISRLPAHTVFLNRPPSVWQQHGNAIVGALIFIFAQSLLIAALLVNIRRRWRVESVLGESEANFQAIFDAIPDAVVFADLDRRIRLVNPAFTRLFGYTAEEAVGCGTEFLHADPADFVEQGGLRFHPEPGGARGAFQGRRRRKDGSEFWAESSGTQILGPGGKVIGLMSMHRDISERKRAELALRESEMRYRSLVENSLDGVLLTTPDGAILAANPEAERIFGRSEDELRRVGRAGVTDPSDPHLRAALAERARTGRFRGELALVHKDGSRISVELSSLVFEDENGRAMTSMIVRDITARKAAEADRRRQAEELTRRNEELERFNRATVGRELDMIALKQQVNALARELGREPPFPLAFLDAPALPSAEGAAS